jgi:hypothetical protein
MDALHKKNIRLIQKLIRVESYIQKQDKIVEHEGRKIISLQRASMDWFKLF